MTLWLTLSLMAAVAAGVLAVPLLRRSRRETRGSGPDIAFYREQLAELDRDIGRGIVAQADAEATRHEIERRVLSAAKQDRGEQMTEGSDKTRLIAIALLGGWIVVGSAFLYSVVGSPDLMSARPAAAPDPLEALALAAPPPASPDGAPPLADVSTMIERLAARLEAEPGDLSGWRMLGWSLFSTGKYTEAISAYEKAVALAPLDDDLLSLLAEAMVRANDGKVDAEALRIIEASLAANPMNPKASYYKGMALDQAGDSAAAITLWLALIDRAPAGADWVQGVIDHVRERARATGFDLGNRPGLAATPAAPVLPGPTPADIQAAGQMTSEDRQAMIEGMVGGLAERLAASPDDPQGWVRLIRSYVVLGDRVAAGKALVSARAAFAGRTEVLALIDQTAAELGLN